MIKIEIGNATICHANSMELLPQMKSDSVDAVITDPPYGLSSLTPQQLADTMTRWASGERDYIPAAKGFMGKSWDAFVPPPALWDEVYRVLKPGGHALVFAGSRTQDLMGLSLRLAGFEVRDVLQWIYGSGFPKSHNISKAIDKAAGAEREVVGMGQSGKTRNVMNAANTPETFGGEFDITTAATKEAKQWEGWGSALKPAYEPILLVRKPLIGTLAENVLTYETGGINIDESRIGTNGESFDNVKGRPIQKLATKRNDEDEDSHNERIAESPEQQEALRKLKDLGRWPANILLDEEAARLLDEQSGVSKSPKPYAAEGYKETSMFGIGGVNHAQEFGDSGGASRFFYTAKASKRDRNEGLEGLPLGEIYPQNNSLERKEINATKLSRVANHHPTVKPTDLMRYLCKLITPPNGIILDPFTGSGSTGKAALLDGFRFIGIEMTDEYLPIIEGRLRHAHKAAGSELQFGEQK